MKEHLFFDKDSDYKGKTLIYYVYSLHDKSYLGVVKWHSSWRQYWFEPDPNCGFSSDCLIAIANFINKLMNDRKVKSNG